MALKLNVKPGEKLFVAGGTLEIASYGTIAVTVEGRVAIVRETDYLYQDKATSAERKLVWALQEAYIRGDVDAHAEELTRALSELSAASQDAKELRAELNASIAAGDVFKALKTARKVVQADEDAEDWPSVIGFRVQD